eukprot:TRINITY_DN54527_c0_g1_i1.p1 TRINITY_DN54527_c0_g1~~TRINITY_DN54527_c0_g1_i1.p1  ORF type:complete len:229 (-),score=15.29 TRINITY_DN54527_c0_g1_i1:30-680(-)
MEDEGTQKLLSVPLERLHFLLSHVDQDRLKSEAHLQVLTRVVETFRKGQRYEGEASVTVQSEAPESRRGMVKGLCGADRARVLGVYVPNSRMRGLSTVVHISDSPKVLECTVCAYQMTCAWYRRHPVSGELSVLLPHNGHPACRTSTSLAAYTVVDGSKFVADKLTNVEFCVHNKPHGTCRQCHPLRYCSHDRRNSMCNICNANRKKRRRRSAKVE